MALASGIFKRYKKLFALDDDGLRRIEGILKKAAASYSEPLSVTFRVQREDDRFYETESIDEVLSDANLPEHRIKLLGIELRKTATVQDIKDRDQEKVAWVIFDKDEPPIKEPDVRIRISSPDKTWALMLADELEPQITRLFKIKTFPNWVFLLLTPIFALLGFRFSVWAGFPMPRPWAHAFWAGFGYVILLFGLMGHTAIADKQFRWLRIFASEPLFLWGEEISHAAERDALRKNIFWVVIIGFLVSIVAGFVPLLM